MRRPSLHSLALISFLFMLFICAPAFASVGRFSVVEGRVDILRPGDARATEIKLNDPVSTGDIVRTKSNSFAEITFDDSARVRIGQSSRVEIKDYELDGTKRKTGSLRLMRGKLRATVPKTLGSILPAAFGGKTSFEVTTDTAVAGVRGTDFFVIYSMGITSVMVLDGIVDAMTLGMPDSTTRVRGGEFTVIKPDKAPSDPSGFHGAAVASISKETSGGGGTQASALDLTDGPMSGTLLTETVGAAVAPAIDNTQTALLNVIPVTETNSTLLSGSSSVSTPEMTLTWAVSTDLDAHLWVPQGGGVYAHVYYGNHGSATAQPYATLSSDITSGFGPETTKITMMQPGTYYYSVHNYSNSTILYKTGAQVEIVANGATQTYTVPTQISETNLGRWWNVVEIDGSSGQVTQVNTITDTPPK